MVAAQMLLKMRDILVVVGLRITPYAFKVVSLSMVSSPPVHQRWEGTKSGVASDSSSRGETIKRRCEVVVVNMFYLTASFGETVRAQSRPRAPSVA
jgi:hypothetical protein